MLRAIGSGPSGPVRLDARDDFTAGHGCHATRFLDRPHPGCVRSSLTDRRWLARDATTLSSRRRSTWPIKTSRRRASSWRRPCPTSNRLIGPSSSACCASPTATSSFRQKRPARPSTLPSTATIWPFSVTTRHPPRLQVPARVRTQNRPCSPVQRLRQAQTPAPSPGQEQPSPARSRSARVPRLSTSSRSVPEPARLPRTAQAPDQALFDEPAKLPEPGPVPTLEGPALAARPVGQTAKPGSNAPAPIAADSVTPEPAGSGAQSELAQADGLFSAKKYEQAGRLYARLAAQNQLPAQRKGVWAYCRWVAVVQRINARPRSDRDWDQIEQEVRSIQRLTPGNWYGEYLQNRVAEARRGGRGSGRQGQARGSRLVSRRQPAVPVPQASGPIATGTNEGGRARPVANWRATPGSSFARRSATPT